MDIAIIIFMVLVVALCAFTVYVVIRDFLRDRKQEETEEELATLVETKLELLEIQQRQLETMQEQIVAQQEQLNSRTDYPVAVVSEAAPASGKQITVDEAVVAVPLEEYEGQIRFSADPKQSHRAKYLALSGQQKAWYDEIVAYAKRVEEVKSVLTTGYEEFKLHSKRVIRLRIKKGTVICEFIIANTNFSRYISTNKISVKQAPTSFKLLEATDVGAAKDSIDIAVRTIIEEREEAKRQQRERRRLARQAAAHAAATTTSDED